MRASLPFLVVTGLAAALGALPAFAQGQPLPEPGKPALNFRLKAYNPEPKAPFMMGPEQYVGPRAKDHETKILLLSFSASFCEPCKKEMPWLEALYQKYRDQGLRVLMVSIDNEEEGMKAMEALISEHKVTYPVLKDWSQVVAMRWLGRKFPLPSVFLVGPDNVVKAAHRGYDEATLKALESEVQAALGIAPAPAAKGAPAVAAPASP